MASLLKLRGGGSGGRAANKGGGSQDGLLDSFRENLALCSVVHDFRVDGDHHAKDQKRRVLLVRPRPRTTLQHAFATR